jgi:hypothetical protein
MAKLPRSPLSEGVTNQYRPVREARASGADPVGQAMEGAGNAGFEIASRMADAKIAADAAEAAIKLRSRLDEEYRAIENDMEGDPAGFEARFRERAAAVANEEAARISSPAMKRAFAIKSMEQTETYSINMRDTTRRRQVEGVKAQTMRIGADYEALALDPSKPRELLDETRDNYLSLIDQQQKAGIYTPDVAEAARIAAGEVYRSGVTTRHLTNMDAMLDAGRYGEAEEYFKASYGEIDPAARAKAEEVLQAKKQEGMAVNMADKLWSGSGQSYETAITEAAKITNVDERLAVEARLGQLKNQFDAGQKATQDAVVDEALMAITSGRSVPSSVLQRADGRTRLFIQDEQRQRMLQEQQMATLSAQEKAAMKEASGISKEYLSSFGSDPRMASIYLEGPAAWKEQAPMMYEYYSMMIPQDQAGVVADINTRRGAGETTTASDRVFADLIQAVPMLQPKDAMGVKYGDARTAKDEDAATEEVAVRASLYRQANAYARETGGAPLTNDQRNVMIARAFREVDPMRYPLPAGTRPFDVMGRVRDALTIRNDLREVLGREPAQAEIDQYMAEVAQ